MYIKLIQPKMKKRPMDTDIKIRMAPPLGLLTIASILRTEHRVTIENENIQPIVYDDHPDIVGITVTVDALPHAIEIAKKFRHKGTLVVAGGIHITTAVQTIPDHCFDVLCVGPAEGSWPDIIRDFKSGCLKDIYRCSESIQGDELISPAYDMLKSEEYLYCNVVHTSRGCPYKCDFCYNSSINRSYLNRTIDDVMKDIENVNSKHIMFVDDNFIGNISWTLQLLERLKPLHIKWNAAVSLNVTEIPGLLDQMKESGCQSLFLGFESIRPSSVSDVHKIQNDPAKYDIAVKEIHDRGIMINASFVFGLDGDTKETFQHTLDWIVKNRIGLLGEKISRYL